MAITGRRAPRVCGVKAGWLSLTLLPPLSQPRRQFLLARLPEHAAQLRDALSLWHRRPKVLGPAHGPSGAARRRRGNRVQARFPAGPWLG